MKSKFTLVLFLLSFQLLSAQYLPNSNFNTLITVVCPVDSTETILKPEHWTIYQTLNDRWDGIVDSTRCINVTESTWNVDIFLDQIDISKPLFVRSELDDDNKIFLEPDIIYHTGIQFGVAPGVQLNLNEDCENDLCSGLIVGIEVPDSSGLGTNMRFHKTTAQETTFCDASFCYPTERFWENYLKEFILKVTFENESITDEWIKLYSTNNEMDYGWGGEYRIFEMNVPEWTYQDTSYETNLNNFSSAYTGLIMYADTTYPSPQDHSYVEAIPNPNVETQEWINLTLYYEQTLLFQPYAYIRGGLVEGSDSLRHHFNLINDGGDLCMNFIEVFFGNMDRFTHIKGDLNFHGSTACMMFRHGGNLKIAKDAYLQYGDGGEGILALGERALVNLEEGSTLAIDNKVILLDIVDQVDQEVKIDLQPGSALIFGNNASIVRAAGDQGNQMINVYMNGGVLDDHKLSDEERQMVNRIYPEESPAVDPVSSILLYPNPVGEVLTCRYNSLVEQTVDWEITNINGQLVTSGTQSILEGINDLAIRFNKKERGVYVLKLHTQGEVISEKFMK